MPDPVNDPISHSTPSVPIEGSVALVTGANRGIGAAFVRHLRERGARTVYAAARSPADMEDPDDPAVVPVELDLTRPETISALARRAGDTRILINNAGVLVGGPAHSADMDGVRHEMDVNYFGTLRMARAFVPVIEANGGGVILNVLSALGISPLSAAAGYSASKAASLSLTRSLRDELAESRTRVVALLPGFVETRMTRGLDVAKTTPEAVVRAGLDGIESHRAEIYPDPAAREWLRRNVEEGGRSLAM